MLLVHLSVYSRLAAGFFFFFTLVTGPRRSLSLKLSDTVSLQESLLSEHQALVGGNEAELETMIKDLRKELHGTQVRSAIWGFPFLGQGALNFLGQVPVGCLEQGSVGFNVRSDTVPLQPPALSDPSCFPEAVRRIDL